MGCVSRVVPYIVCVCYSKCVCVVIIEAFCVFSSRPHTFGAPTEELLRVPSDSRLKDTGYRLQVQAIYTGTGAGGKWSLLQFAEYASLGACLSAWPCIVRYLWILPLYAFVEPYLAYLGSPDHF